MLDQALAARTFDDDLSGPPDRLPPEGASMPRPHLRLVDASEAWPQTNVGARRAAFDAAVVRHRSELVGVATRLAGSRAEADDLVQEAMLRAWSFWDRFEEGTNGRAWMHRILFNTFVNGYRRRRREREILAQVAIETALDTPRAATHDSLSDEVEAALASLPADFKNVLVLVDIEELSYRDAADALRCPIGTVMSRLHRARRAMKLALADYARESGIASADEVVDAA